MSLEHPRKSVSKGEYGRRPYIDKWKAPYRDTQGRVPNKQIFDKKLEQMSEFIKPYLTDDYSSMEHYYPAPHTKFSMYDWSPTGSSSGWDGSFPQPYEFWDLPEGTTTEEMWEEGWTGWYIVGCILDCFWAPTIIQTDKECEQGEFCCELDAFSPIVNAAFISIEGRGAFKVTSFDQNRVCFEFRGNATTTTYPVTLRAYYRHKHGTSIRTGWCDDSIWPRCVVCDCETTAAMTIDEDETPDTIDPSGDIEVYIADGCPPFTWSASGAEFSFATAETEGRANTLSATAGACGSTTVTVTDECETADTVIVRSTEGEWVGADNEYDNGSGNYCHPSVQGAAGVVIGSPGSVYNWEYITGDLKVLSDTTHLSAQNDDCSGACAACGDDGCTEETCLPCIDYTIPPETSYNSVPMVPCVSVVEGWWNYNRKDSVNYYTWSCA